MGWITWQNERGVRITCSSLWHGLWHGFFSPIIAYSSHKGSYGLDSYRRPTPRARSTRHRPHIGLLPAGRQPPRGVAPLCDTVGPGSGGAVSGGVPLSLSP